MLVLDQALSASLLGVAVDEQWAWHAGDRSALYRDPTTAGFLAKGTDEKLRQQALWDLLLHYPAVISPCDNLDISGLQDLGLVDRQLDHESQLAADSQLRRAPEVVRSIEALVLADLADRHPAILAGTPVETFLRLARSEGHDVAQRMDSAMFDMFDTYEEYVAGMSEMFGDDILELPGGKGRPISGSEFAASLTAGANRDEFLAFKAYQPFRGFMHDFAGSAHRWLALTHASRSLGAVMSADIPKSLLYTDGLSRQGNFLRQVELAAEQGSTHVAVQIWVEGVTHAPRLRSIGDVLELRKDRRIDAFRSAMTRWTEALSCGSPADEAALRKEVRAANEGLRWLPGIERVERFWSFASIAVDVFCSGFFNNVPVTGIIGLGIGEMKRRLPMRNGWVMFGSR
ncbi:hypothetical protein CAL12_05560 [Bordetella genomosp. 8]|uniref:Uncharacterized protein n=1 Tax=Bordetella genomosp. 8 TaxID=1416806 RepID=A0A1W6YH30_9BORD|nr:hypothetical protein [Bordetella genomosp. 8]ARP80352.1 hypothetical protein CAL12_05560 [Bordetella genomosp. 8]